MISTTQLAGKAGKSTLDMADRRWGGLLATGLVAALLAGLIAAPASAAELVFNGGFEHPAGLGAGWSYTVSNDLGVQDLPSSAHSGDHWLRFKATEAYAADEIYQTLDTVVGEVYTYSFWVGGAATTLASTNFYASIGSYVITNFVDSTDFPYTQFNGAFIADSTSTELRFRAFNESGFFKLDDISVTGRLATDIDDPIGGGAVPEPSTWAMMLLGLGSVGAALRMRRAPSLA